MSEIMPPSPPVFQISRSGKPDTGRVGYWFFSLQASSRSDFSPGIRLGPRKENRNPLKPSTRRAAWRGNDPKAPLKWRRVRTAEGVIHALVYKKDIVVAKPKPNPSCCPIPCPCRTADKPPAEQLSGYRIVESPYRTEETFPWTFLKKRRSFPCPSSTAWPPRIAGGNEGLLLAEDGNQNVLVGQIVTRIWPAATGDASVDKQRFERVEVPFTLEFQGDRVKQLLGLDTKFSPPIRPPPRHSADRRPSGPFW